MIEIRRYNISDKEEWNDLLINSRIDSFLFNRDFMDYHSDRFQDFSFMIYRKGKLAALLPGNLDGKTFHSHQGLTYGGLISTAKVTTGDIIDVFKLINEELSKNGVTEVVYKPTPWIYHKYPAQEDIYALYRMNAEKIGCNLSTTIFQHNKLSFIESRKSGIRKAKREGVSIVESNNLNSFWIILEDNLMKLHNRKPVHSIDEILLLKERFPKSIRLYVAEKSNEVIAGCLVFLMKNLLHTQYISSGEIGRQTGALDLLFDELINRIFANYPVFDFGHSTEQLGRLLNENLIFQKEGFGGRGVVYDVYKYTL
jgi:hypothetical protein